ncbi:MAG: class I SAM-dependent methyltransferase [Candidatus Mcinerneyibacterium aminivorans]|uniref:Class I SAM-dependent methyltransferase n=1 Tax=Candidatus Mcinerneyibacterium aminivorans TaxID=2703815 RepID=A0A5D0MGQ6_9BACT|nr:MAG: class I SAM-dependent methyltransferase [Candidatus Mcinerneyibacterium aminivorans]
MINDIKDAFGHYFMDIYKERDVYGLVIERDDGYIDVDTYDYFAGYQFWPKRQKKIIKYIKGKVLDIGCGPGSHLLELKDRNYDVAGIDTSQLSVQICKKRGLKNIYPVALNSLDSKIGIFDTFLMLGNNFGLMKNEKKAREYLKKLSKVSNPEAVIIAETMDPYKTTNKFHKRYHKKNRENGRLAGQLRVRARYKIYKTNWMEYLLVSKGEMKKIIKNTDWKIDRFINSIVGPGYIAVLKKKK